MTDPQLLASAIEASGLSARRFAVEILYRDERTVRRWLAGDSPVPEAVMVRLLQFDGDRTPRCDCGDPFTVCAHCAVADYQAAHPNCPRCCPVTP